MAYRVIFSSAKFVKSRQNWCCVCVIFVTLHPFGERPPDAMPPTFPNIKCHSGMRGRRPVRCLPGAGPRPGAREGTREGARPGAREGAGPARGAVLGWMAKWSHRNIEWPCVRSKKHSHIESACICLAQGECTDKNECLVVNALHFEVRRHTDGRLAWNPLFCERKALALISLIGGNGPGKVVFPS